MDTPQTARILVINGSYRDDGVIDRVVELAVDSLRANGASIDEVRLREYPIEFCLNCRACTQQPGDAPGECVHHDGMAALVERIEHADAFILASPTNFSSVTAVFKRFLERLVVYAYWPWGKPYPVYRKADSKRKKALLISSSAAPGVLGRWLFQSLRQLKITAKVIGAKPVGSLFTGTIDHDREHVISARTENRARSLALKLLQN